VRCLLPRAAIAVLALGLIALSPMTESPNIRGCANGVCTMRMTAPQLLARAAQLVQERRFDEARPMLAALENAPELTMETRFLKGYVAAETGDLDGAAKEFRAVLRDRPDVTRARLELARVLMMQGHDSAADHHFRLAEEDEDLPEDIARTVREARGILRNRRTWHLNIDVGFAPDSNINNATDARTVAFPFGAGTIPLTLNEDARRRSGVGQTASVSTGVRLRMSDGVAVLLDADGQLVNYKGKGADDVSVLLAAGPELTTKGGSRIAVQATGIQRWYGGQSATTGGGVRVSYQRNLDAGSRVGLQLDVRRTESGFGEQYDGWQSSAYATYERVVHRSAIASGTLFVRRDDLRSKPYSSTELGGSVGIGGELPHGINAGISGGISRVLFDDPLIPMAPTTQWGQSRKEWRYNARAYLGARGIRVLGFSPSVSYTYNRADSTLDLYQTARHRVQLGLARYF